MTQDADGGRVDRTVGRHAGSYWSAGESADGEYLVWEDKAPDVAIAAVLPAPGHAWRRAALVAAAPRLLDALLYAVELHPELASNPSIRDAIDRVPSMAPNA